MDEIQLSFDIKKAPHNMLQNSVALDVLDKDNLKEIRLSQLIAPTIFALILALFFFVCYSLTGGDGWIVFGGFMCYFIFATSYVDYCIGVLCFYIEKIIKEHKKKCEELKNDMTIREEDIQKSSLVRLVAGRIGNNKK